VHRPVGLGSVAVGVAELDLHAVDDGLLEGFEMRRRGGRRAIPARRVEDDGGRGGLRARPHGLRQRAHQLAQSRLHLGRHVRGRAGDEEQGLGLGRGQAAEIGAPTAQEGPAPASPTLGVHGYPGHREGLEVTTGRPLRDLELLGELGRGDAAAGLQDQ
jgi:hypothetical protein